MFRPLLYSIFLFLVLCRCNDKKHDKQYMVLMWFGQADSITSLNKGVSLANYAYFDLETDSVLYRDVSQIKPSYQYQTFLGSVSGTRVKDTLLQGINAMNGFPNGQIKDAIPNYEPGDANDGYPIYVEYNYGGKKQYVYYYWHKKEQRLNNLQLLLGNMQEYHWPKRQVDNIILNSDSIAVEALKKVGVYDSIQAPNTVFMQ